MAYCTEFAEKMTLYIDHELTDAENAEIAEHLAECESCRREYEWLLKMLEELKNLEEVDLPPDFHQEVMAKIRKTRRRPSMNLTSHFNFDKSFLRGIAAAAAGVVAMIFIMSIVGSIALNGINKTAYNEMEYAVGTVESAPMMSKMAMEVSEESIAAEDMGSVVLLPEPTEAQGFSTANLRESAEQITLEATYDNSIAGRADSISNIGEWQDVFINHYNVTIKVEDFNYAIEVVSSLPGYSENSYTNLRGYMNQQSGYATRRVEAADYEYAKSVLKSLGKVVAENEATEKVSSYLLELRVSEKVKQDEIDRLFAMLEKSDSLRVMTAVVNRIEVATGELDGLRSQIMQYNSNAGMPYLNIEIISNDVSAQVEKENTFGEKMRTSLVESVNFTMGIASGLAIFISAISFPAFLLLIFIAVVLAVARRFKGGRKHE